MASEEIETDLTLVGIQFYTKKEARGVLASLVSKRPLPVRLLREPDNPVDPNAIRVIAGGRGPLSGKQIGHVAADVAAVLAPKFDNGTARVVTAKLDRLRPDEFKTGNIAVKIAKKTTKPAPAKRLGKAKSGKVAKKG